MSGREKPYLVRRALLAATLATALRGGMAAGSDWPTYRHDNARSGMTGDCLSPPLSLRWVYAARHKPKPAWPPPAKQDFWHNKTNLPALCTFDRAYHVVSADGRVYFGTSADDRLVCLDAKTGRPLWTFFAEGPIRLAPAIDAGRVYFGSDDGHAYCLDAADGRLIWKHNAAGSERRIPGNGRIISERPVRSGVMVHDGKARLTAGLFPTQGVFEVVLDAETGKLLARTKINISPQGYMELHGNEFRIPTGRMPVKKFAKAKRRGETPTGSLGEPPAKYPYAFISAGDVRFAGGDNEVAAFEPGKSEPLWKAPIEGRAYSLAVADGRLFVSTDEGKIYCFGKPTGAEPSKPPTITPPTEPFAYPNDKLKRLYTSAAESILKQTKLTRGYCLVLDAEEGRLVYELARQSELQVIGFEDDAAKVAAARRSLDRAGLYGRVVIHHGSLNKLPYKLPYGDWLFNLVMADGPMFSDRMSNRSDSIWRVLAPGGTAWVQNIRAPDAPERDPWRLFWTTFRDSSQWTHTYANAANTACSGARWGGDRLALQWFGRPGPEKMIDRHHRTFPPLFCHGLLFVPGNERVFAVCAYNGTPLWDREVPGFRRVGAASDCGNMVATYDVLYLAVKDRCLGLDARTGEEESSFPVPGADKQPLDWGYLANVGHQLFGSATAPGASRSGHSREAIKGTYYDFTPVVTSRSLFCLDRRSGKLIWQYDKPPGAIVNTTITIGGGRMYFVESADAETLKSPDGRLKLADLFAKGANLVAMDIATGKVAWARPIDLAALQHRVFGAYADEKLLITGSRNQDGKVWYDLHAFDAITGKSLWRQSKPSGKGTGGSHGEQDQRPVIVGNTVYLEPHAWKLDTGEPVEDWKFGGRRGCGIVSASEQALFFRAGNPTAMNLKTRKRTKITAVSRPGCWINIIPAGGLLLIPEASSGCTCGYPVQASMAFIPAPEREEDDGP